MLHGGEGGGARLQTSGGGSATCRPCLSVSDHGGACLNPVDELLVCRKLPDAQPLPSRLSATTCTNLLSLLPHSASWVCRCHQRTPHADDIAGMLVLHDRSIRQWLGGMVSGWWWGAAIPPLFSLSHVCTAWCVVCGALLVCCSDIHRASSTNGTPCCTAHHRLAAGSRCLLACQAVVAVERWCAA
jgi:hypothetical protein